MWIGLTVLGLIIVGFCYLLFREPKEAKERKSFYHKIYILSKPQYLENFRDKLKKEFTPLFENTMNIESGYQVRVINDIIKNVNVELKDLSKERAGGNRKDSNETSEENEDTAWTVQMLFARNTCPVIIYEKIKDLYYPQSMPNIEPYFKEYYEKYENRLESYVSEVIKRRESYAEIIYSDPIETQGMGFGILTNSATSIATYAVMDKMERNKQIKNEMNGRRDQLFSRVNSIMKVESEYVLNDVKKYYKDLENKIISECKAHAPN